MTEIEKKWGSEIIMCQVSGLCIKQMIVGRNSASSIHRHSLKSELFYGMVGVTIALFEPESSVFRVHKEGNLFIPAGSWHSFHSIDGGMFFEKADNSYSEDNERAEAYLSSTGISFPYWYAMCNEWSNYLLAHKEMR